MDAHQKLVGGTGDRRKASTHAESDAEEAMTCTMVSGCMLYRFPRVRVHPPPSSHGHSMHHSRLLCFDSMMAAQLKVVRGIDDLCPLEVNATVKLAAKESTVSSMVSCYTFYNSPSCKVLEGGGRASAAGASTAEMSGSSPSSNSRRRRRRST
jgi:hypothetical protein